jgi:hypothetical protein
MDYQQSGFPPPVPAQRSSGMPKWIFWAAGGCGCLLVGVVVLVAAIFFGVKTLTAEPEKVVSEFLAAAGRGDGPAAYAHFSEALVAAQSYDEFAANVMNSPHLFQVTDLSYNSRNVDLEGAHLKGTATLQNGAEVAVSFDLIKEGETWKVLNYQIGDV